MKKILSKLFSWQNITSTIFVFFFMWLLSFIGLQFEFLNVFEQVLQDYHLTDVYYTKMRDPGEEPYDDRIVIVNIGDLDRRGIAAQINALSKYNPKVIGIDVRFFEYKQDTLGDYMLADAISKVNGFVLGSELQSGVESSKVWDTLLLPIPLLLDLPNTSTGFVNIGPYEGPADFATWRSIPPVDKVKNGIVEPCFASEVLKYYDKPSVDYFYNRGNEIEHIYFKGNIEKYLKLDVEDVLTENFTAETIEGKIILMGYMGSSGYEQYFFDADRFYTPLNERGLGRGHPDMYGVVVHANIISMILDKKYINDMSSWMGVFISVVLCFINVAFFTYILQSKRLAPFYGLTKIFQLAEMLVLAGITLYLYSEFQYKSDFSLAIFAVLLAGDLVEIWVDIILVSVGRFLAQLSQK